jgi:hypothetical protein
VDLDPPNLRELRAPGSTAGFLAGFLLALLMLASATSAAGQDLSEFFELANPARLTFRPFASGYGAEKYGTTHEGFELDQTITGAISLVGRVSAYQIYQGTGFDSPLIPSAHSATRDFGRFQGGVSLALFPGATFIMTGGEDLGDSHAPMLESDFSSWLWLHTRHPVNVAYSSNHYFENGVSNGLIDMRAVVLSTRRMILLLGAGGAIWGGGTVGQAKGQGGPDAGVFLREWRASIDLQAGYGSSHTYGTISLSRSFSWDE